MYRVVVDPLAADQIAALPRHAVADYARVLDALELAPWNGAAHHEDNPDGAVRHWLFGPGGAGQILYLVVEGAREIHVLVVQWPG